MAQHFNRALFDGSLPLSLLVLKRGIGTAGHFSTGKWQQPSGYLVPEIALDPGLFGEHSWLSLMQTVVHQQCHLWQYAHGCPGRSGPRYHNAEWAAMMESIGLMPSDTGRPEGRKTGQGIQEYPLPGGPFLKACVELAEGDLSPPLAGRYPVDAELGLPPVPLKLPKRFERLLCSAVGNAVLDPTSRGNDLYSSRLKKRKIKYCCPTCSMTVWGCSGLGLRCQSCNQALEELPVVRKGLCPTTPQQFLAG